MNQRTLDIISEAHSIKSKWRVIKKILEKRRGCFNVYELMEIEKLTKLTDNF